MRRLGILGALGVLALTGLGVGAPSAAAQPRIIEVQVRPVRRAQIAIWLERPGGEFVRTLALTQATALRGIGNRPGASQMNSGYNWPYGRREGVLPVWGHRRASAPGATQFRRVIFQDRTSEGWASRSASDFSRDNYYCLSFNQSVSSRDNLDAMTCPSVFNSDKGRYLSEADVSAGYAEPFEVAPGSSMMRSMELTSLYPPRRDVAQCTSASCFDHADIDRYAGDARAAMPEIDAVTMATPPEGMLTSVVFTVPDDWEDGDYVAWVEVNVEGDYNADWNDVRFPTPSGPEGGWDFWALSYGYAYRGQPSVAFRVPFAIGGGAVDTGTRDPAGYGTIDGLDATMHEMDGTISNDPTGAPGSGADRLFLDEDNRVRVIVIGPEVCEENTPPGAIEELTVTEYPERRNAHRFADLRFLAASDDIGITRYDVRISNTPITDAESFMRAVPAEADTLEHEALVVPRNAAAGEPVEVSFGGLSPESRFYIAVRAHDRCNLTSPIASVEYVTPPIHFTTVSPCFVATAAYGSPLGDEIGALRRFRDRHLRTNAAGRALVSVYETVGPHLADIIRENETLRAATRMALRPLVALVSW